MDQDSNYLEITDPKQQDELMFRSGLSIQLASYEPEENVFLAAHSSHDSVIAARFEDGLVVWSVVKGTKEERVALAAKIREAFTQHTNGEPITDSDSSDV